MNTLIVYSTKYGCTEKCAEMLSEKLGGRVELCNLKKRSVPDLAQYDRVIIGGSVYIGRIQKEVSDFVNSNVEALKSKKTGCFICCMREGDEAKKELAASFPKELLENSAAADYFGGEFVFGKMNFIDRIIVKKVAKTDKDSSSLSEERINRFAEAMGR